MCIHDFSYALKDIREAAEAEKQRKKQEKKKQRKRQRKLEKIAEKAKEAEQKKLDGNNEGRKNYNSKKIKPDTNCISDPSCSSEDMRVKAEAEKQGKKPDMKKEKEPKEKVETEERKKGEADQRNPKRMRIETKILGASSLRELHKELMVSDRQYSDNTKNWLRKNNPSSINLHKHGKHKLHLVYLYLISSELMILYILTRNDSPQEQLMSKQVSLKVEGRWKSSCLKEDKNPSFIHVLGI